MKRFLIITGSIVIVTLVTSCSRVRRSPGRTYMPDMAYSRAYETYASTEDLKKKDVNYNAMPVPGTVARGDMFAYALKNDSAGYAQSAAITNPLPALSAKDYLEASRLYLVNCGICHGEKLDGNGPLWKGGDGPFPSAPKNFMDDAMKKMPEGTMFHSATYGKNMMGSYASQLNPQQRWMIIHYIKEKQKFAGSGTTKTATGSTAKKAAADSTAAGKK